MFLLRICRVCHGVCFERVCLRQHVVELKVAVKLCQLCLGLACAADICADGSSSGGVLCFQQRVRRGRSGEGGEAERDNAERGGARASETKESRRHDVGVCEKRGDGCGTEKREREEVKGKRKRRRGKDLSTE